MSYATITPNGWALQATELYGDYDYGWGASPLLATNYIGWDDSGPSLCAATMSPYTFDNDLPITAFVGY